MCLFVLQKCIYYLFIDDTSITLGSPLWRRKVSKPLYHRYRLRKNQIYSLKKKKKKLQVAGSVFFLCSEREVNIPQP